MTTASVPGPGAPAEPPAEPSGEPERRRRFDALPLIVVGVVLAVLAAIGCLAGGLVVIDRQQRREPTPPPATTPSPSPKPTQTMPGGEPSGQGSGGPLSGALSR
ncbi:MAG: hypothetical protein HOV79_12415 [Hamadaea sp.]|nr:hypothetical protein [Hamadaea sp.]